MSFSSPIPTGAAERIIRNPHSLPRIPAQLAGVVASHRHKERLRAYAEQAHQLRRSKVESYRNSLILEASRQQHNRATTPSPPTSPTLSAIVETPNQTNRLIRRSPSFSANGHRHRRRSFLFDYTSLTPSKSVYYTPENQDPISYNNGLYYQIQSRLSPSPMRTGTPVPTHHRRHSIDVVGNPAMHHVFTSPFAATVRNPEERAKLRCKYSKKPSPSWRSASFSSTSSSSPLQRRPSAGSSHPSWHRLLRDEYKYYGLEDLWKEERNRFLQDFRRDRQFQKQMTRRRLSDVFN